MELFLDPFSLLTGFLLGVIVLGVIAFIVFRIRVWWGEVTKPFKKQTVTHQTDASPFEILSASCCSLFSGIGILLLIVVMAVTGVYLFHGCSTGEVIP